jgi:hypothetical protein
MDFTNFSGKTCATAFWEKAPDKAKNETRQTESARIPISAFVILSLQGRHRINICFLPRHAPIAQILQGNCLSGHRAQHMGSGFDDFEITVQISQFGLTAAHVVPPV